jgi:acyl-[acyl-carrier-protein]-phospholipid O-acyltransferase/long-chain-fatty-acid--[acyl-carrier-protein] ligase
LVFTCEPLYATHTWWSKFVLDTFTWLGYGTVIPLGRDNRWAMRSVAQAVVAGRSVVIFPEGQISADGADGPVMPGLAWLQTKLNCPVIELRIEGAQRSRLFAKRGDQWWPRIHVHF